MTPSPDLNRPTVSGESSDEEENNMVDIDTTSDNITVKTTTIQNVLESKAVQESQSDDESSSLSSGIQVEGDDSLDLSDINDSDQDMSGLEDNEEVDGDSVISDNDEREDSSDGDRDSNEADDETAKSSEHEEAESRTDNSSFKNENDDSVELDINDYLPETSLREIFEMSERFQQDFMFKCFAMLLLYWNAEDGILFYWSLIFLIPGIVKMVCNPVSTLRVLYLCLSAKTVPLTIISASFIMLHNTKSTSKLSLCAVLLLRIHAVVRRQVILPTMMKLHGRKSNVGLNLWNGISYAAIFIYSINFSFCLGIEYLDCWENLVGISFVVYVLPYIVHYGGVIVLFHGIVKDGSRLYSRIELKHNHNFWDRFGFCLNYLVAIEFGVHERMSAFTGDNTKLFSMTCL